MSVLQQYKCPCCDGAIEFDTQAQKMKCPYCDTEFEMQTLADYDKVLQEQQPDDMSWQTEPGSDWQPGETENMRIYSCSSCGGEIVGDATTAATECPFCGNPVVLMGQFAGDLKPDYVIPFKFDKAAAKAGLLDRYKCKKLLRKIFKDENHLDEIKGIYVPFWLFDADANAHIRYKATRVRSWSDSNYHYTKTSYYAVMRAGTLGFCRVPVDGSTKMDDALMESVEPFDFREAVDFQTAYLSGFLADKYDVTAQESIKRANDRIRTSTEQAFASTVMGYHTVLPVSSNISLQNASSKYALYPVWVLNTNWNGKKYTFAMNGQTGKMVGDLPMDKGLFWKWFAGIAGAVGTAVFLLSWLIHML